jgi:DNA-binding MarR family transcriptional regulator
MMPDLFRFSQARKSSRAIPATLLTWTTNFVNTELPPLQGPEPMPPAKRPAKPARAVPLRNTPQLRRASQPVIDLGVLNERLGYFVRRVQVWVFQDFIRRLSSIDISPAQFSVLVVIGANSGLSQAELAATLGIERARLVRLLHRLERRGLTQRLPSSADGRRHALRLTRDGQKLLARAKALAAQHEAALKQKIGAERHRVLIETLREF